MKTKYVLAAVLAALLILVLGACSRQQPKPVQLTGTTTMYHTNKDFGDMMFTYDRPNAPNGAQQQAQVPPWAGRVQLPRMSGGKLTLYWNKGHTSFTLPEAPSGIDEIVIKAETCDNPLPFLLVQFLEPRSQASGKYVWPDGIEAPAGVVRDCVKY